MSIVIEESWLPATFTAPPMNDEQFAEFCSEHPDLFIEMTAEGEIVITPPNFPLIGIRNSIITAQLQIWAWSDRRGKSMGSSAGFVLPNGARRSPDASWVDNLHILGLDTKNLGTYWHLCPDFVIELRSPSDRLPVLREKMREWIENGAQLGWLVDPERRAVETFRPNQAPETLPEPSSIHGEGPVAGFTLSLAEVWDPLA